MRHPVSFSRNGRLIGGVLLAAALCAGATTSALAEDRQAGVDPSTPHPVVYPTLAQTNGEEGTVVVSIHISAHGRVKGAKLYQSSGHDDLDTAAIQTAMNWKYLPAVHGGEPTDDWANVQIVYKLPKDAASQ
jgi:TonB family protein